MVTLRQLTAIASIAENNNKPPYDRYPLTHVAVYRDKIVASDGHMLIRVEDNFAPDFFTGHLEKKEHLLIHTSTITLLNKRVKKKYKDSPVVTAGSFVSCDGFSEGDNLEDYLTGYPGDDKLFEANFLGKAREVPKAFNYEYLARMQKAFGEIRVGDIDCVFTDWEITWFENKCLIESENVKAIIMGISVKK